MQGLSSLGARSRRVHKWHRNLAKSATAAWGEMLVATRQTTYQPGSIVAFGVSALILYWLLYRSRLVPVRLSV